MAAPHSLPAPAAALFSLLAGEQLSGVDWEAVGVFAHATGLGPLLLHNAGEQLPPLQAARLRLAAQRTQARNATLLAALAQMLRACRDEALPLIVLK
ncbi:MAG: hypothetical protein KIS63_16640, partial [Caldilineales bacterium]|nr:hypothetical protein [Caldilineales bacterium]